MDCLRELKLVHKVACRPSKVVDLWEASREREERERDESAEITFSCWVSRHRAFLQYTSQK